MKRERKNNYKCNRDRVIHVSGRKRKETNKKNPLFFFGRIKSITFIKINSLKMRKGNNKWKNV
jgi:hypothetical protein